MQFETIIVSVLTASFTAGLIGFLFGKRRQKIVEKHIYHYKEEKPKTKEKGFKKTENENHKTPRIKRYPLN